MVYGACGIRVVRRDHTDDSHILEAIIGEKKKTPKMRRSLLVLRHLFEANPTQPRGSTLPPALVTANSLLSA